MRCMFTFPMTCTVSHSFIIITHWNYHSTIAPTCTCVHVHVQQWPVKTLHTVAIGRSMGRSKVTVILQCVAISVQPYHLGAMIRTVLPTLRQHQFMCNNGNTRCCFIVTRAIPYFSREAWKNTGQSTRLAVLHVDYQLLILSESANCFFKAKTQLILVVDTSTQQAMAKIKSSIEQQMREDDETMASQLFKILLACGYDISVRQFAKKILQDYYKGITKLHDACIREHLVKLWAYYSQTLDGVFFPTLPAVCAMYKPLYSSRDSLLRCLHNPTAIIH